MVAVILIITSSLGTVPKCLENRLVELEIRGKIETLQASVWLRSARILRRVLEAREDLQSLKLLWKTTRWHWCKKKLTKSEIIVIKAIDSTWTSSFHQRTEKAIEYENDSDTKDNAIGTIPQNLEKKLEIREELRSPWYHYCWDQLEYLRIRESWEDLLLYIYIYIYSSKYIYMYIYTTVVILGHQCYTGSYF